MIFYIKKKVVLLICMVLNLATTCLSASLVSCPDCDKPVSRNPLMCPNCGLKGEVIAEYAKTIPEPIIGDILNLDCDGVKGFALPVEIEGRKFAIFPFDYVLGASRLQLFHNGNPIEWFVPELAEDAPIVRLEISSTNLSYWVVGGDFAFTGNSFKPNGNSVSSVVSSLVGTNAFELSNRKWQVLQPRQMKNHGRQILKMLKGEPSELPQRTHPYFKMIENENMKKEKVK